MCLDHNIHFKSFASYHIYALNLNMQKLTFLSPKGKLAKKLAKVNNLINKSTHRLWKYMERRL